MNGVEVVGELRPAGSLSSQTLLNPDIIAKTWRTLAGEYSDPAAVACIACLCVRVHVAWGG